MSCKLQFQIHYLTQPGENLFLKISASYHQELIYLPLNYIGYGFWGNEFDFPSEQLTFDYAYVVKDNQQHIKKD